MNPAPSLFLIGPMGAGKTTVGRRVAAHLGLDFFDLDHEIETRSGATITLIFGYVVYLETTVDQQLKRLVHDRKRPLLAAPDRRERLTKLAAEREPLYRETADLIVPTGLNGSSGAAARRLVEELGVRWQRSATSTSSGQAA